MLTPHSTSRRPLRTLLGLLALLALVATACGSDDPPDTDDLLAASDDLSDLNAKPAVPEEFLTGVTELVTTDLVEGDGETAQTGMQVSMQYVGVLASDGTQFDASWDRNREPFEFTLGSGQVITGWDEGIVGMKEGGRRVLQIPFAQAYGEAGRGASIPQSADLVFIVDLLEVQPPPPTPTPPPPAPPVPEDALGSFDELGIIDLVEGEGPEVVAGDLIAVQYVGVGAEDGVEFDSTWSRGALPFRVVAGAPTVIEGWQTGLIGMKVGGERILQIPAAQAYGDERGDLVFRVHLEERADGPLAHTSELTGEPPTEIEISTITEGEAPFANLDAIVSAHIAVRLWSTGELVQSTYGDGQPTEFLMAPNAELLPGLLDGMTGIGTGELRRIVLPFAEVFPDGVPEDAPYEDGDAFAFFVEALVVSPSEDS